MALDGAYGQNHASLWRRAARRAYDAVWCTVTSTVHYQVLNCSGPLCAGTAQSFVGALRHLGRGAASAHMHHSQADERRWRPRRPELASSLHARPQSVAPVARLQPLSILSTRVCRLLSAGPTAEHGSVASAGAIVYILLPASLLTTSAPGLGTPLPAAAAVLSQVETLSTVEFSTSWRIVIAALTPPRGSTAL